MSLFQQQLKARTSSARVGASFCLHARVLKITNVQSVEVTMVSSHMTVSYFLHYPDFPVGWQRLLLKLVFRSVKVAPPLLHDYFISDLILKTDSKADRPKSRKDNYHCDSSNTAQRAFRKLATAMEHAVPANTEIHKMDLGTKKEMFHTEESNQS